MYCNIFLHYLVVIIKNQIDFSKFFVQCSIYTRERKTLTQKYTMPRPLLISAVLLLLFPLQIISEPLKKENLPLLDIPLEIVLGENYSLLYNDLIFLKLQDNDIENLSSPCRHAKTILNTVDSGVIVAWRLLGSCAVPLIQYHGKNYVVPIAGYHPRLE